MKMLMMIALSLAVTNVHAGGLVSRAVKSASLLSTKLPKTKAAYKKEYSEILYHGSSNKIGYDGVINEFGTQVDSIITQKGKMDEIDMIMLKSSKNAGSPAIARVDRLDQYLIHRYDAAINTTTAALRKGSKSFITLENRVFKNSHRKLNIEVEASYHVQPGRPAAGLVGHKILISAKGITEADLKAFRELDPEYFAVKISKADGEYKITVDTSKGYDVSPDASRNHMNPPSWIETESLRKAIADIHLSSVAEELFATLEKQSVRASLMRPSSKTLH